jgi:hypothetical protein
VRLLKIIFYYLLCVMANIAYSDEFLDELEESRLNPLSQDVVFVSLGSVCRPTATLRLCGLRKAAFPFDWLVSFDCDGIIRILEDDFREFLNEIYFIPFGPDSHLLQNYYHLEFIHDGSFDFDHYFENMERLKTKFQRRIARFRHLNEFQGKVFFIREAYQFSTTDPHRWYQFKDNIKISDEYAIKLYDALKNYFPKLDFSLIIINHHASDETEIERQINDHLLIARYNPAQDDVERTSSFKKFYSQLLEEVFHPGT